MHVSFPTSQCRFGIARGDITPPVGIYQRMWGAALHDRSEGIHRLLTATACVFQPYENSAASEPVQVVIGLDHCLLGRAEMESLLDAIHSRTNLPRESILVAFSHTHGAGLMSLDRAELPGGDLIPPYLNKLSEIAADLVQRAAASVVPAVITYGTGRCNLAAYRDLWDEETQQWVCGFNPQREADDTVLVGRVTAESGELIATIVNYACHPTTLAWDNRLISPDYPGAMRETIEQATHAPCLFLQGASGELGPLHGFVGDTEVADRNGRQLGLAALSTLESLPPPASRFEFAGPVVSGATIGVWEFKPVDEDERTRSAKWYIDRRTLPLRYRPGLPKLDEVERHRSQMIADEEAARRAGDELRVRDCRALAERDTRMIARLKQLPGGETFPYRLSVWRMGTAIWVAAQGEPYNILQTELRKKFPEVAIIVCALANGWGPSYLPPAELYDRGIYQETIAALAPGSLEQVIAEAAHRIEKLLRE